MQSIGRSTAVQHRLTVLAVVLLLWGVAIFAQLISIQVMQHDRFAARARAQQEETIDIPAPRGSIFDRNGRPLAISVPVDSVSVNPQQIVNRENAATMLSGVLHLDRNVLLARLKTAQDKHKGYMWVKRHIDPFETEGIKALKLDWVTLVAESERHYPKGETASHILGGVYREEEGAAGIERSMEKVLKGTQGSARLLVDVKRRGIDSHVDSEAKAGTELTLTIDERMQYIAERELAAGVKLKHARSGSAIVMDPYTGEILALANYPTYNPNDAPRPSDDKLSRLDLGASVPFEPGSIFKVVTLAAALETTDLRPESLIPTGNGVLKLPGRIIHESHHGYGTITMQQVLEKSSNIGAIMIGARVGRDKMYEYARRFGFGQKSGLPVPAESAGLLRPLSRWGTTSLASISMGQEVSTTSVQLARACSVIANGGMLVRPKIIAKRGAANEPTEAPVRILKPETVMTMRMMMEGVVLRGTAQHSAHLDGYTSAGKTGTAQIFDTATHHYTHNYNASFMGFAPVTNPRLVVVVTVNGTTGDAGMGSAAAAPIFRVIAQEALRMRDVPRDIPEDQMQVARKAEKPVKDLREDISIADLGGPNIMEEDSSIRELLASQMKPQAVSPAESPIPAAKASALTAGGNAPAQPSQPIISPPVLLASSQAPRTNSQGPLAPDFRGQSMRDVVSKAAADGIELTLEGSGVARAQLPPPGSPLPRGNKVRVVFTR